MSYQCVTCREYALDLDEPNCKENCTGFSPRQVTLIHLAPMKNGQRPLTCTGELPVTKVRMSGSIHSTTCPKCIEVVRNRRKDEIAKIKEQKQNKNKTPEVSPPQQEEEEQTPAPSEIAKTLSQFGVPAKDVKDIEAFADSINDPTLKTPSGLKAWIDAGNDLTTINGIGPVGKKTILDLYK
jgi:predicted flap endonuclease-1-like 5' DNA nuclease